MVLVFIYSWDLLRLEQEVVSHHLEHSTRQRKDISVGTILVAQNDLRRTVLSSLDILGEVLGGEASVAHVCNLKKQLIVQTDFNRFPS